MLLKIKQAKWYPNRNLLKWGGKNKFKNLDIKKGEGNC